MLTLITISFLLFTIYMGYSIYKHGVPKSLSETYYLYGVKGWIFTFILFLTMALIIPGILEFSKGSTFQFLSFLAPASVFFVATAPKYLHKTQRKIHYGAAIFAIICGILWVILVANALPIFLVVTTILSLFYIAYPKSWLLYLELVMFYSIYFTLFLKY